MNQYIIKFFFIAVLVFCTNFTFSQKSQLDTVFINGNQNIERLNISKKTLSADISVTKSSDSIISFPSKLSNLEPHYIGHDATGWVECLIKNTNPTDTSSFLYYTGEHLYIKSYIITGNDTIFQTTGWMKKVDENGGYFHEWVLPIKIPPNKTIKIITSCNSFMRSANLTSIIFSNDGYFKFYHSLLYNTRLSFMLFAGVIGLLIFLSISAIWQYILIKDYVYIFWAIYLFSNALMGFRFLEITFDYRIISNWFPDFFFYDSFLGGLIQIAYLLFMFSFLERENRPKISMAVMKIYNYYLAITMIMSLVCYYFIGPWAISSVFFVIPFLFNIVIFFVIATLLVRYNQQKKTATILITGSTLYVLCCLVTTLLTMFKTGEIAENSHNTQYDFYFIGLVFELTFFFVALAYRQRKNENKVLLTEKENNFLRQQFLRTQMNPHFIFNVLNSISDYVWVNDKAKANAYLLEFSKLIRATLDNSNNDTVLLSKELETLRLYVSLENLRFDNKINFIVSVSPEISPEKLSIPPLIIQPYIENAIWHGILHKENKSGEITLNFSKQGDSTLLIEITDNGIGRVASRKLKESRNKNKSFGTSITKERINIANKIYGIENNVNIIDLYSDGLNCGTKIAISLTIEK